MIYRKKFGKVALASLILFALLVQAASFMLVAKAQPPPEQFSIINPGPSSYPSRWNASSTVRDYNTSNFIFYSNETSFDSTFFMNVTVTNVTSLFGWGIGIIYDNTTLQFVRAWLPTNNVFAGAVDAGGSLISPSPVVAPVDATHQEIQYGAAYTQPTPPWSFNGTGTMAQIEFQIIKQVNSTSPQASSLFTFDPVWTTAYFWPSGSEVPGLNTGSFVYYYPLTLQTARLAFNPSTVVNYTLGPPSSFSLNITIMNATDLFNWSIDIYYNNTVLNATNAAEGSFLNSVGTTSFASSITQSFNATDGQVVLSCTLLGGDVGAFGNGSLATVTFQVLANGTTAIELRAIRLYTSSSAPISSTETDGYFSNVQPYTPPPLLVSISPLSTAINVGQTAPFTSTVSGGVAPYSFQWFLNGTFVPGATSNSWNYTAAAVESDTVFLSVTDSNGTDVNSAIASLTATMPTGAAIYVDPSNIMDLTLGPSSIFSINITIANVTNLTTCVFNLTYVPSIISSYGIQTFQVQGQYPILTTTMDGNAGYAWVTETFNYSNPISTSSPAPIARFYFYVNAYGISPLNLTDTQLLDNFLNPTPHNTFNGLFANIIRDVAVTDVGPSSNLTFQGFTNNISVTVANLGNITETFTAYAYYNYSIIGTAPIVALPPGAYYTATITWNTTVVPEGNYTITGIASTVPYEYNLTNNICVDGNVQIIKLIQDLVIINVLPSSSIAYEGQLFSISVTAENLGNMAESFDVNASSVLGLIGTQHVTALAPSADITLTFIWNTTLVPLGNYTITGACTVLPYENNTANNVLVSGTITVAMRDLAVTMVTTSSYWSSNWVYQGGVMQVNVTAANLGSLAETFNVSSYYNNTQLIGVQQVSLLAPSAHITVSFAWNTSAVVPHNYTITGSCSILPYDINVTNNALNVSNVTVRIVGDVNGDGKVDISDVIVVENAFGSYPTHPRWNITSDVNADGIVNMADITLVLSNFGKSTTY
ncbi:MAG: CARDB domain-containing protein [Candidatus Bathyarchaeia archaeon]